MVYHFYFFSEKSEKVPLFGTLLTDHLRRSGREIAYVLEECIVSLLDCAMSEEVCTLTF